MKKVIFILSFICCGCLLFAQKKMTSSATIIFDATTGTNVLPKAENKTVVAAIELKSGGIAFEAVIKSFSFSNPMMQEHFNSENWLDSDKFPTSTFKGKITNLTSISFTKDGNYPANVTGDLTIHGITKPVTTSGSLIVNGKAISVNAEFVIKLEDYDITSKAVNGIKIAKEPKITVAADFK
jgi:polyisoprenoid-binding protein YceI